MDISCHQISEFIPKQLLDTYLTKNFSSAADRVDKILQVVFWILLLFNLGASGKHSMEHFIVMINSLQIAIHLPFLNVLLPSNVIMFCEKMLPIVMFDIIKDNWYIIKDEWKVKPSDYLEYDEKNNGLINEPQFPRQMANLGYNNHNFL